MEQRVVEVRLHYPDWDARKLRVVLAREGVELPRNTIHRILLRHDLIREEERHSPATQRFERGRPNELWQMDFKGPKGWPQAMGPLSVLDDHSRYLIVLAANGSAQGEPVRERLEEAFQRCGVPEEMLMDPGIPWWGMQSSSGQTRLSLWLMRQGIRLRWSGIRKRRGKWSVSTDRYNGRWHDEVFRESNRRPGWMRIVGSITTCDRTKH